MHLLAAKLERVLRLLRLGAISSLYGLPLSGCITAMSPDVPVEVRVIHSGRPQAVQNADLVEARTFGFGILQMQEVEDFAKRFAYESEADVIVIRPAAPHERVLRLYWSYAQLRFEAWRTKGYTQKIQDDIPELGSTLLPPPGTTYTTRFRNVNECVADARQSSFPPLTEQERSFLSGRDTRAFVDFLGHPKVDYYERPRQFGLETRAAGLSVPKGATDRYVLCLMKRGYQWPQAAAAKE